MRLVYLFVALLTVALPARAEGLTSITLVQSSLSFNFVPLYICLLYTSDAADE